MSDPEVPDSLRQNTSPDPGGQKALRQIKAIDPSEPDHYQLIFFSRIITLTEEWLTTAVTKDDGIEKERLGWFLHLEGSYEKLYIGETAPQLQVGDRVRVTIRKEPT